MKQSEMYRLAQGAVVKSEGIDVFRKLEILRRLMKDEDVALFVEAEEEKKKAEAEQEKVAQAV